MLRKPDISANLMGQLAHMINMIIYLFFCSLLVCSMLNCYCCYAGEQVYAVLSHVADALLAAEGKLNELDNLAGDGDCGSTLSRGASGP